MVSHSTTLPCIPPSQRHPSSISVPTAWVRMQILFHVQNHEPAGISPLAPPALTVNVLVAYCMALVYMSVQKINLEKWEKKFKKDAVRKSFFFWIRKNIRNSVVKQVKIIWDCLGFSPRRSYFGYRMESISRKHYHGPVSPDNVAFCSTGEDRIITR